MYLVIKRFFYLSMTQATIPFIPMFAILNFVAGALLIVGLHVIPVLPEIALFEIFQSYFGIRYMGAIWGGGLMLSSVLHGLEVYFRNGRFGVISAWISLMLWSYMMGAYVTEGMLFAGLMTMPFVFFWGWYLVKWRWYLRQLKAGVFPQIH